MKLSQLWLKEWVNYSLTEQQLADQLTMAGLEVDAINPVAGMFDGVVVAQILSTKPHPDAARLTLCEVLVEANAPPLKIVCGAANVRAGLKVALAKIGAHLPGPFTIKEAKLRGELSQGMLCSLAELRIAEHSEGIMELDEAAPLGVNLREYLQLEDQVLDIDLTPNRADCFSVLGVAREVAALNQLPLIAPEIIAITPSTDAVIPVHLGAKEACPHYCGRIIRGINLAAITPVWMSERLRRSGIRTIHPIVDVMNYVMLELGQPMHAYDLAKLKGSIHVRYAHEMERLQLLDGQQIHLNEKVLVIADEERPLALAGIMGGAYSAVGANTQDVFLESAFFHPLTIAGVARQYSLFSDSSQRFERGVDPSLQNKALERATSLLLSIVGGQAGAVLEATSQDDVPKIVSLKFDPNKVLKLTGVSIPLAEMKASLERLGLVIRDDSDAVFSVEVPTHRFDVHQEVDLVEEIVRLHGYDKLKPQPMQLTVQAGQVAIRDRITTQLTHWFCAKGYHETINYSFVDPTLQETLYPNKEMMQLLNPISSELSQMRVGLWPGLLASMIYNLHRQQNEIKFFEMGVVFDVNNQQLFERSCVAALVTGELGHLNWSQATRRVDFYDLKGDIESLLSLQNIEEVKFVPAVHDALHPGQSAQIMINGQSAGWLGALHPRFVDALEIDQDVLLFELQLDSLIHSASPHYHPISKYPQIRRDLSFLVDKQVSSSEIEALVRATIQEGWLKAYHVFDLYMGKEVPKDKKSMAISITLPDANRTLIDSEINLLISAIIKALEDQFSILLRD